MKQLLENWGKFINEQRRKQPIKKAKKTGEKHETPEPWTPPRKKPKRKSELGAPVGQPVPKSDPPGQSEWVPWSPKIAQSAAGLARYYDKKKPKKPKKKQVPRQKYGTSTSASTKIRGATVTARTSGGESESDRAAGIGVKTGDFVAAADASSKHIRAAAAVYQALGGEDSGVLEFKGVLNIPFTGENTFVNLGAAYHWDEANQVYFKFDTENGQPAYSAGIESGAGAHAPGRTGAGLELFVKMPYKGPIILRAGLRYYWDEDSRVYVRYDSRKGIEAGIEFQNLVNSKVQAALNYQHAGAGRGVKASIGWAGLKGSMTWDPQTNAFVFGAGVDFAQLANVVAKKTLKSNGSRAERAAKSAMAADDEKYIDYLPEQSAQHEPYQKKMKQLIENWGKFINEQLEHYEMECVIKAEPDTQIYGSIFNKIRAVQGVTILKTSKKMQQDSQGNKYIQLNIKIMLPFGMGIGEFKHKFNEKMKTLTDDEGDRIISSRILGNPQLIEPN